MLIAMAISSFMCVFSWDAIHNGCIQCYQTEESGYNPYDATHVITQFEILLFSALAFTILNLRGKYPPELPSVNLDLDWVYRKAGRFFLVSMSSFWNGLNKWVHSLIVVDFISKVGAFTKGGHVHFLKYLNEQMHNSGLISSGNSKIESNKVEKRARLGIHSCWSDRFGCLVIYWCLSSDSCLIYLLF